jgi:D-xylose 1-dehydrogenase
VSEGTRAEGAPTAVYADLEGSTVFISGGATGIGRDLVTAFVDQGSRVVFVDINEEAGQELCRARESSCTFIACDVTDDDALRAALGTAEALGGLDVLVNNAGNDTRHNFGDVDGELWDATVAVNLRHQFIAAQTAYGHMRGRGRGSIINFGSVAPSIKVEDLSVYNTCKAAVRGLTRSLAREMGGDGIRVNSIIPGAILTPRQRDLWYRDEQAIGDLLAQQSLKRSLTGADVAQMALFLASEVSGACTGQEFTVDAGIS